MKLRYAGAVGVLIAAAAVLLIPASGQATGGSGHTLALARATLLGNWDPNGTGCPAWAAPGASCFPVTTHGAVPGLGTVRESYVNVVENPDTTCELWSSRPVLRIPGKGTIDLSVQTPLGGCVDETASGPVFARLVFTVTGGQGLYANGSGSGGFATCLIPDGYEVDFYCPSGTTKPQDRGPDIPFSDTLTGSLIAPNTTFDTTPPTIRGAVAKTVRAAIGKRRVRVRFTVTARDNVDGTVAAHCKPHSGSRFKLGRTKVVCSATDSSANKATARFTVTVRKHRGLGAASVRAGAHRGGSATFLAAYDLDYLDPGQTYYTFGYTVLYATNRTLYSYKPGSVSPVPDLATGPPQIANNDRTITVHIKRGIHYSPPLQNRVVSSKDIKYAIERAFTANVPSGYAFGYFSSIVGAPPAPGAYRPISGITTPNRTTIVFHLKRADAVNVAQALVMPITVPVPKSYAFRYDQQSPSTYNQHVLFTGPYMVKKYVPGDEIELVRNPSWKAKTDYRPAYLNSITIREGNTDLTLAAKRALTGSDLLCCDAVQLPGQVLGYARAHYSRQIAVTPSRGTTWIALNTRIAPLRNLNVRKAIVAALDRRALLRTRGPLAGRRANGYLPPGIPGFRAAGGYRQNTNLDFMRFPSGNMALAKKYMLAARRQGVADINAHGIYTGPELIAVGAHADINTSLTAQQQLAKLGFRLNLVEVSEAALYTQYCGVPRYKVAICMNVRYFADYGDPEPLLKPTFDGRSITPAGNVNWSLLNNRPINAAIARTSRLPVGPKRNHGWAKVNHMIAAVAPGVPYMWGEGVAVGSKNINLVASYYGTPDLDFTSTR